MIPRFPLPALLLSLLSPSMAGEIQESGVVDATTEMLGVSEGTVCAQCHAPDDAGGTVAATMRQLIDSLDVQFDSAQHLLERCHHRRQVTVICLRLDHDQRQGSLEGLRARYFMLEQETETFVCG